MCFQGYLLGSMTATHHEEIRNRGRVGFLQRCRRAHLPSLYFSTLFLRGFGTTQKKVVLRSAYHHNLFLGLELDNGVVVQVSLGSSKLLELFIRTTGAKPRPSGQIWHLEKAFPILRSTYCSMLLPLIFPADLIKFVPSSCFQLPQQALHPNFKMEAAAQNTFLMRSAGEIRGSSMEQYTLYSSPWFGDRCTRIKYTFQTGYRPIYFKNNK